MKSNLLKKPFHKPKLKTYNILHNHHDINLPKISNSNSNTNLENKKQKNEIDKLFLNPFKFKFLFLFKPYKIYKESIGLSLKIMIRMVSIIYALRAISSSYNHIYFESKIDYNLIINFICIITSFLLYLSLFKLSRTITTIAYYIFLFHLGFKIFISGKILIIDVQTHHYPINAFIGIILGLSSGSLINLYCTWIVFSYMVYTFNYKKYNPTTTKIS